MKKFDFVWIPRGLALLNLLLFSVIYILSLDIRILGVSITLLAAFLVSMLGKKNVTLLYFLISLGEVLIYFLLSMFSDMDYIYFINFNTVVTLSLIVAIINTNLFHIFLWKPNQKIGKYKLENPRKIWNNFDIWIPRIFFMIAMFINVAFYLKLWYLYESFGSINFGSVSLVVVYIIIICFVLTFLLPIASAIFYFLFSIFVLFLLYHFNKIDILSLKIFGINLIPISFWLILIGSVMLIYAYCKSYLTYEETVTCDSLGALSRGRGN